MNKLPLIVVVCILFGMIALTYCKKNTCADPGCQNCQSTPPPPAASVAPTFTGKIFNYTEGLAVSKQTHADMLVVLGADKRCIYCRKLEKTLKAPELQADLARYIQVRVDVDKERPLARKLGVEGKAIPCYMIVHEDERILKTGSGYKNVKDFQTWLKYLKGSEPLLAMMSHADAIKEAKKRWGRQGDAWLTTYPHPPERPNYGCAVGVGRTKYGEGQDWENAFANADQKMANRK